MPKRVIACTLGNKRAKPDKQTTVTGRSQYRLIVENGQKIPEKDAFLNVNAYFNRFVVKTSSTYNLSHTTLHLLCCLYSITKARGNYKPFALTTLSRNYYVPFKRYKTFIARCHELHKNGLATIDYKGKVKGAKINITQLGVNALDEMYKDFSECMLKYPELG